MFRTGGLDVGPRETAPGVAIDIGEYARSMTAEGVPFEQLDGPEIARRWPAWRLDDGHLGLFQADGGLADPSRGNVAHRRLAVEHGAVLREHAPVARIDDSAGETMVILEDGERLTAGRVIVAADAWTNDLLEPLGAALPLTVTQEQVSWFTPRGDPARFAPDRFPVWIWMDEPSFYGFPTHGHAGPKVGQDVGGRRVTAATRTFDRDEAALARVNAFLAAHLPDMAGEPFRTKTCLYTLTPDRDFVLDAVPGHPGVLVALGSAHGYKFASLIGRIMAELALDGATPSAPRDRGLRLRSGGAHRVDAGGDVRHLTAEVSPGGPPDGGGCGDSGRVPRSGALADGDRHGRGDRGGAVRRLPGGLSPDDPATPPPPRAAVDRGRLAVLCCCPPPRPPPRRIPSC